MSASVKSRLPLIPLLSSLDARKQQRRISLRPRALTYIMRPDQVEDAIAVESTEEAHSAFQSWQREFLFHEKSYLTPPRRGTLSEKVETPLTPGRQPPSAADLLPNIKRRKLQYAERDQDAPLSKKVESIEVSSAEVAAAARQKKQQQQRHIESMRRLVSQKSSVALGSQQAATYGASSRPAAGQKRTGFVARCA